jgi:hypothetical protein
MNKDVPPQTLSTLKAVKTLKAIKTLKTLLQKEKFTPFEHFSVR